MPRLIIVGYDPGLTTAFAALDLRGNFITAQSKREWPSSAVAQAIRETGRPLIIAVDKKRASEKAEKFAARFGCRLWTPEKDLGVREKNETVKEIIKWMVQKNEKIPRPGPSRISFSSHEKDAIAAAVFAYKGFAGLFSKIDDTLGQVGMERYKDDVKRMVVLGEAKNVNEALERIREGENKRKKRGMKESAKRVRAASRPGHSLNKREAYLRGKMKELERSVEIQRLYIGKLEKKVKELERSRNQLKKEQLKRTEKGRKEVLKKKEVQLRENMISNLRTEISRLKRVNERLLSEVKKRDERAQIAEDGRVPLVPVEDWSRETLEAADRTYKARDKVLWVKKFGQSNAAARYCIALGPKAVVMDCDEITERTLRNADITVVKGTGPQMHEFYGSVGKDDFEGALKGAVRAGFLKWLRDYQKR